MKVLSSKFSKGFALPTVIITSVVMMIVLLVGLTSLSSISTTLNNQRYGQLAREAARAGVLLAQQCIDLGIVGWSDASPLRPGRDCNGGTQGTAAANYVVYDTTLNQRTTFTVGTPVSLATGGYLIQATGTYETKRSGTTTTTKSVGTNVSIKYTVDATTTASVSSSGHGQVCALLKVPPSTAIEAYCWGQNEDGRAGIGIRNSGSGVCDNPPISITYVAKPKDGSTTECEPTYRKVKDDTASADNTITLENGATASRTRAFRNYETDVASGSGFACALSTNGTISTNRVYCWGNDYQGRLGQGQKVKPGVANSPGCPVSPDDSTVAECHTPVAVKFSTWENDLYYPVDVAAGIDFACVLAKQDYSDSAGRVYCWGHNNKGQLGRGTGFAGAYSADPAAVINYTDNPGSMLSVRSLFVGVGKSACAVSGTYVARCWGENNYGQIGNNSLGTNALYPQSVIDQNNDQLFASKIALSGTIFGGSGDSGHACAITKSMPSVADGQIYCWGKNDFGELGTGAPGTAGAQRARPMTTIYPTAGGTTTYTATDIAAAHMTSCAQITVPTPTKLYCWGKGDTLGVGSMPASCTGADPYNTYLNMQCSVGTYSGEAVRGKPAPINWSGADPISVVGGGQRFCMIEGWNNWCWGANNVGQIGNGKTVQRLLPTRSQFLDIQGEEVFF